ncbi:hypothetical protein F5B21DRAFT_461146 [Xylaria acuta]|nr:hypothetical protein F5B21DRAFT_461146 [Xylaria acuta]
MQLLGLAADWLAPMVCGVLSVHNWTGVGESPQWCLLYPQPSMFDSCSFPPAVCERVPSCHPLFNRYQQGSHPNTPTQCRIR